MRHQYVISRFRMLTLRGEHGTPARRATDRHQRGIVRGQQPPDIRFGEITNNVSMTNNVAGGMLAIQGKHVMQTAEA